MTKKVTTKDFEDLLLSRVPQFDEAILKDTLLGLSIRLTPHGCRVKRFKQQINRISKSLQKHRGSWDSFVQKSDHLLDAKRNLKVIRAEAVLKGDQELEYEEEAIPLDPKTFAGKWTFQMP